MSLYLFLFAVMILVAVGIALIPDRCRHCGGETWSWSTDKRYCHDCDKRK